MDDREVAAAIASGDPAGIAIAYDRYAAALYGYCHWMLQQPAGAADALRDAFVTAATRLGDRAGSAKLRPLLYVAARDQCRHRLRAMLTVGGSPADADQGTGTAARQQDDLPELARGILGELKPREREVAELTLRHNLNDADLATVLAVSRRRARARAERACALVARHIEQYQARADHEPGTLRPEALFGLLPMAEFPPELREQVLRLCSSPTDDAVAYRRRVASRRYTIMAPAAWVGLVWAVGLVLLMFTGSHASHALAAAGSSVSSSNVSPATAATSPSTPTTPHTHASVKRSPIISKSPAYVPPPTTPPTSPTARTAPPPTPSHSATPKQSPTPTQSATPSRSPSPKPTHSPSPSPSPTVTPTPTPT